MSKKKILILGAAKVLNMTRSLFDPLRERYKVKETHNPGKFHGALQGGIDLAIVISRPHYFFYVIDEARAQGSKVPVIFLWKESKKKRPQLELLEMEERGMEPQIVSDPSGILREVQKLLGNH